MLNRKGLGIEGRAIYRVRCPAKIAKIAMEEYTINIYTIYYVYVHVHVLHRFNVRSYSKPPVLSGELPK